MVQNYNISEYFNTSDTILKIIENKINQISTAFIVKIVAINGNKVDCQAIFSKSVGDTIKEPPILNNLLVCMPSSGTFSINIPLNIGDTGIALVMQEDISTYAKDGQSGINNSSRKFNFIDSIFIPTTLYATNSITSNTISIVNGTNNTLIEMKDSGDITIKGSAVNVEADNVNVNASNATIKADSVLLDGETEIGGSGGKAILTEDAVIMSPHGACTISFAGSTKSKAK